MNETGEASLPWLSAVTEEKLNRYRGFAGVSLQNPGMAVPALTEALDSLGLAPTKTRGYALSKLAEAHVQTSDIEQACDVGAQAFMIAAQLGDTLGLMAIRNVRVQLMPWKTTRAVRSFDERV